MAELPLLPLGEVAEVRMGRQRSPRQASGDHMVAYLRAANVKDGSLDLSDVKRMNFTPDEQDAYRLRGGDVLVTEGCGSLPQLGASSRWADELAGPVCFQNTLLRLRAVEGITLPGFVDVLARWLFWTGKWAEISSGTNIFHIGARRAAALPVPVPPLDTQRRIVDLVGSIDRAVAACRDVVEGSANALRAVRDDLLFGGEPVVLGDLLKSISGGRSVAGADQPPQGGEAGILKLSAVQPGFFDPAEVKALPARRGAARPVPAAGRRRTDHPLQHPRARRLRLSRADHTAAAHLHAGSDLPAVPRSVSRTPRVPRGDPQLLLREEPDRGVRLRDVPVDAEDQPGQAPPLDGAACPDLTAQQQHLEVLAPLRSSINVARRQVEHLQRVRTGVLSALMSGAHTIPNSYDRLLTDVTEVA